MNPVFCVFGPLSSLIINFLQFNSQCLVVFSLFCLFFFFYSYCCVYCVYCVPSLSSPFLTRVACVWLSLHRYVKFLPVLFWYSPYFCALYSVLLPLSCFPWLVSAVYPGVSNSPTLNWMFVCLWLFHCVAPVWLYVICFLLDLNNTNIKVCFFFLN